MGDNSPSSLLLAKELKPRQLANALSESKMTSRLKKPKKPLMVGGGVVNTYGWPKSTSLK